MKGGKTADYAQDFFKGLGSGLDPNVCMHVLKGIAVFTLWALGICVCDCCLSIVAEAQ